MFIDTHCHVLSEYYDNINEVVNQCKKNNVNRIIVNGCDINSNKEVLELVNKYDVIYGAIGFHPTELDDFKDEYSFADRKKVAEGTLENAGYYTIKFDEEVPVTEGERYAVVLHINTPESTHPMAIEYDSGESYLKDVDLDDGEGYISYDGAAFINVKEKQDCNLCIKAFSDNK